jgi:hypothetical protein
MWAKLGVSICDIRVKRKISLINEMKQDKISLKLKVLDDIPQNFLGKIIHFCSLSFICDVLC